MISRVRAPEDSVAPASRGEWRRWLQRHHGRGEGVWLVLARTGAGGLDYESAVEEALCFGWIDSRSRSLDARRRLLWMAPRRAGSGWAKSNKARIERLAAAGRMAPPGLACVEAAKRDGSWHALDAVEALVVPEDLQRALREHGAEAPFAAFAPSSRREILAWIASAKRPGTRARRIAETARLAAMNVRVNQQWALKGAKGRREG